MSEESKKIESIEKAEESEQDAKAAELSDKDLDNVAGGSSNLNLSKSNVN